MDRLLKGAAIEGGSFLGGKFPFDRYEVEFKFYKGRLPTKGRPAQWKLEDLQHILDVTRDFTELDPVRSYSVVRYSDNKSPTVSIRKVKTTNDDDTFTTTYERKKKIHNESFMTELASKLTVSEETSIDPRGINFFPDKRRRDRYSFIDNDSRFDITIINEEFVEVELEILDETFTLDDVKDYVRALYGDYLPGDIPYDVLDSALKFKDYPFTTTDARELSRKDLSANFFFDKTGRPKYFVSVKADGIRGYLVMSNGKVWIITNLYFKLIHTVSDGTMAKFKTFKSPTVIEVEVMKDDSIFMYDCILLFGRDEKNMNYEKRFNDMIPFRNFMVKEKVPCSLKEIFPLKNQDSFFDTIETVNSRRNTIETDGLVFTPNCPYYITDDKDRLVQRMPMDVRTSGNYPDILKWKDVITIDFMVGDNGKLYFSDRDEDGKDQLVLFDGDSYNPYLNTKKHKLQKGIYEFKWEDGEFVMRNPRPDKVKPNNKNAVMNNWRNIMNPITIETLTGKDMILIRNHHNLIKKSIFSKIPTQSHILDIGGGRGGDLYKYPAGSSVVAVDPSEENLREFRLRYSNMKDTEYKPRVNFINGDILTSVKKIEAIGVDQVDAVTLMLSASFFWKSPESVQKLADVINKFVKPGGTLAIFTINGDVLRESLHLNPKYNNLGLKISLKPWEKGKGQVVKIDFPGTITETQKEYCVFMDCLESRLPDFSETRFTFKGEEFMSKAQKEFNNFYTVHMYTRKKSTKKTQPATLSAWRLPREIKGLPSKYSAGFSQKASSSSNVVARLDKDFKVFSSASLEKSIDSNSYYKTGVDGVFYLHSIPDDINGLLHAILRAGHSGYLVRSRRLITVDQRKDFVVGYRSNIPKTLISRTKVGVLSKPYSPTIPYWCICRNSKLSIASLSDTKYLFSNIQEELMSNSKLNESILWFIAKDIECNIYILKQHDMNLLLSSITERIHEKNIVIIEVRGSYVVACHGRGETIFTSDHPFIEQLNDVNPVTEEETKILKKAECVSLFFDSLTEKFIKGGYFSILEADIMDSYLSNYIKSCLPKLLEYCDNNGIGYDLINLNSVLDSK